MLGINWEFPIKEQKVFGVYLGPKVLAYMVSEHPENAFKNGLLNLPYLPSDTLLDNYSDTLLNIKYLFRLVLIVIALSFVVLRLFFSFFEKAFLREETQLGNCFLFVIGLHQC